MSQESTVESTQKTQEEVGTLYRGRSVVPGVVFAPVAWVADRAPLPEEGESIPEEKREEEFEAFTRAVAVVAERLDHRADQADGHAAEVLKATAGIARDRAWSRKVKKAIAAGSSNLFAVRKASEEFETMFLAAGGVMAERVTDLRDVRDRVLAELRGEAEPGLPAVTVPHILFADDLAPADTATLDPSLIHGIVTQKGGATSHTAIIARQLNIPCIVAAGDAIRSIQSEKMVLCDASLGTIELEVDEEEARSRVHAAARLAEETARWTGPAQTSDGHRVQLLVNVGDAQSAHSAAQGVAEGIGLYRTELGFLESTTEPTVEEQAQRYAEVFSAFPEGKIVIRTLDAGSDKPVPFVEAEEEENPALGVRGVRIQRTNKGIVERQLDAIVKAQELSGRKEDSPVWVMAPMVATNDEAELFAQLCHDRGLIAGVMIEVPAAALMAETLMKHLDFVSIGTNDLTQYTMAADRMSSSLVELTDPWQPAVLRLIEITARAGKNTGAAVGVCGEAAADPHLSAVLTGLGVNSLSAALPALPTVGATLSKLSLEDCQQAADIAVKSVSAESAREAVRTFIDQL